MTTTSSPPAVCTRPLHARCPIRRHHTAEQHAAARRPQHSRGGIISPPARLHSTRIDHRHDGHQRAQRVQLDDRPGPSCPSHTPRNWPCRRLEGGGWADEDDGGGRGRDGQGKSRLLQARLADPRIDAQGGETQERRQMKSERERRGGDEGGHGRGQSARVRTGLVDWPRHLQRLSLCSVHDHGRQANGQWSAVTNTY